MLEPNVLQISDTHLMADNNELVKGVNTYQSFCAIMDFIKSQYQQVILLLTGDLSNDGSLASYQTLKRLIDFYQFPVYCIPGNHDDLTNMAILQESKFVSTHKTFELSGWQFILLNSQLENEVSGKLSTQELTFLKQELINNQSKNKNIIICLHHHPISIQSELMDVIMLENHAEFNALIQQFSEVKIVLYGHVHQENEQTIQHITYLGCPSTCAQFLPGMKEFALDTLPPGFRWITLSENHWESGITRLLVNLPNDFATE